MDKDNKTSLPPLKPSLSRQNSNQKDTAKEPLDISHYTIDAEDEALNETLNNGQPNLDDEGLDQTLQVEEDETQQILENIANPNNFYDFTAVNSLLETLNHQEHITVIPIQAGNNYQYLEDDLTEFLVSNYSIALIPLHINGNHFGGIYIEYNFEEEQYHATYFDPLGLNNCNEIPARILEVLHDVLQIESSQIIFNRDAIQHTDSKGYASNNHCGAYTIFILTQIAQGNIAIRPKGEIYLPKEPYYNGLKRVGNLSQDASDQLGRQLREEHLSILQDNSPDLPDLIAKIKKQELEEKLKQLILESLKEYKFEIAKKHKEYLSGKKITEQQARHASTAIPLIRLNQASDKMSLSTGDMDSGFDENFKTAKRNDFTKYDIKLGFADEDPNLKKAHIHSRSRTHEIVHLGYKNAPNEIHGHIRAIFSKARRDSKDQKIVGSPIFHKERQQAIEKVLNDPEIPTDEKVKQAMIAALTYDINHCLKYKDLTNTNIEFQGYTAAGYDLSNPEQRQMAFKVFQAIRDRWKMTVAFLNDPEFSEIDEELFSPLRTGSPFSNAIITATKEHITTLSKAPEKMVEEASSIHNTPVPSIFPPPIVTKAKVKKVEEQQSKTV